MNEVKEILKIAKMLVSDSIENLPSGFVDEMERLDFDYDSYSDEFSWESGYGYEDEYDEYKQDSISAEFYAEIKPIIKRVERLGKKYNLKLYFNTSAEYGLVTVEARPIKPLNFKVKSIGIDSGSRGTELQFAMEDDVEYIDDFEEWLKKNWKKIRSRVKFWSYDWVKLSDKELRKFLKSIDFKDMYMDYRSVRGSTVEVEVRKRLEY